MASTIPGSGNPGSSNPALTTAASTSNKTHAGKKTLYLKWMMPKGGFIWPNRPTVTKRMELDLKITASMVQASGADFKINKPNVVTLLVEAFEAFAAGILITDPSVTDREIATASAFAVAQTQVPWLTEVSVDVFMQLTEAVCKARVAYVMGRPDDQYYAEWHKLENSQAHRLFSATDDFIETFVPVARRWEGVGEGDLGAALTAGMGLGADFGFELPPMQEITCHADAERYRAVATEWMWWYGRDGEEEADEGEEDEEDEEDGEDGEDGEYGEYGEYDWYDGEEGYEDDETMGGEMDDHEMDTDVDEDEEE